MPHFYFFVLCVCVCGLASLLVQSKFARVFSFVNAGIESM